GGEVRSEAGGAAASAQLGLFDLGCNRGGAGRGDLLAPAPGGGRGPTVPRATGRITEFLAKSGAGAVWQRARFGTVRPRVQIPGPRPISCSSRVRRRRGERSAEVATAQSLNRTIAGPDLSTWTNQSARCWNMTTTRSVIADPPAH